MKKKNKTTGDVLLEVEPYLQELVEQGLQFGDIINLVYGYLEVHCPEARETYVEDSTHPILYYGHYKGIK